MIIKNKTQFLTTGFLFFATSLLLLLGFIFINSAFSHRELKIDSQLAEIPGVKSESFVTVIESIKNEKSGSLVKFKTLDGKEGSAVIVNSEQSGITLPELNKGDWVKVNRVEDESGVKFSVFDVDRTHNYYLIFSIFILTVVAISGWFGVKSIFALILSILFVFNVIIPQVAGGANPVLVTVGAGIILLGILMYISHGFNKATTLALAGAIAGILITIPLSYLMSKLAFITGAGDENALFLQLNAGVKIDIFDIAIASFIMGVLGVIDDATISQVSIVQELFKANSKVHKVELFKSAMKVGVSHIGALVNTLFLTYLAVSLPFIALIYSSNPVWSDIVGGEIFAQEIVRTIVGSMGLILSIPFTTFIAVLAFKRGWIRESVVLHKH